MNPQSPGPELGPGLETPTQGSSPHPQENQEVRESAEQQQRQEQDNSSMDTPHRTDATQSELPQEECKRQKLLERLHIEPPLPSNRLTTAPSTSKEVEARKSYTSFGDNGTTASVSAYGDLLQISQYFGIGHSGFFCADLPDTERPWASNHRLRDLLKSAQNNTTAIGINWKKAFTDSWDFDDFLPCLEFVDDRWPRFVSPVSDQCVNDMVRNSQDQMQTEAKPTSCEPRSVSALSENFTFSIQYFCHDGTIFQKCTLKRRSNATADLRITELELQADLLIRNLDFTENCRFNERCGGYGNVRRREIFENVELPETSTETETPFYDYRLGYNERSLEIVHHITQESDAGVGPSDDGHENAVVLTITPYVNGALQSLNLKGKAATMDLSNPIQHEVNKFGVLDVVLAYKLQFGDGIDNKPVDFETSISKCLMDGYESYEKIPFSKNPHLDFIIRRNLEHILSVCSVPLPSPTLGSSDGVVATSPIALTCGDISGHYVGLAASFYAFQFLCEIGQYLETKSSAYAKILRKRIQTTCNRHLKWVFESTELPEGTDQPKQFAPHYWVSGEMIPRIPWLSGPSRADTPLQILKLSDNIISKSKSELLDNYMKNPHEVPVLSHKAWETLPVRAKAWLQDLDQNDERKRYAFERTPPTDKPKFHLVDHVWISQALKALQRVYQNSKNEVTDALKRFQPELVERHIVKRFITENPISKQRMIATSRTASETRFIFHSKDTALFHAMDSGFFSKEQLKSDGKHDSWKYLMDEWRNTIECQAEHEETQELKWRKPLWYALSFILASKERSINKTPPDIILNATGRILFGMASSSGLFPGYLTSSQAPMEFEDETYRDSYWQTSFEIPYILWKYGKYETSKFGSMDDSQFPSVDEKDRQISTSKKEHGLLAKKMQFAISNKLIDPRGLVEISDDWLQQAPEALIFGSDPGFLQSQNSCGSTPVIKQVVGFPNSSEEVASAGWDTYHSKAEGKNADSFTDEEGEKGLVVDVPRGQDSQSEDLEKKTLQDNKALMELLGRPRDIQSAKKRLIWLPKADKETAMVCCLASPPEERYDLSAFFDRHAFYDKYFSDDTSATLNEWKTEFQLSFYRLAQFTKLNDFRGQEGIPKFSYVVPQPEGLRGRAMNRKENTNMATGIVRAAMGFRFVGDFFDRYWTCHFLEYLPENPTKTNLDENIIGEAVKVINPDEQGDSQSNQGAASTTEEQIADQDSGDLKTLGKRLSSLKYIQDHLQDPHTGKKKYLWQQRKVLELLLFDQILLHIEEETKDIFDWARGSVLKVSESAEGDGLSSEYSRLEAQQSVLGLQGVGDNGQLYKMAASDPLNPLSEAIDSAYQFVELGDSEGYFNIIGRWRLFEEILQTLGEDLNENLERIEEWSSRERDREPESPRWTRNDERLYRNTLIKLRVQNQRKVRNLERLNTNIQTFRDSLTGRLESIREDMSFRGSENMSLFTYVTVIFLPLGFATGIFSMSEAPGRLTLAFMVATAVTSLSITVLALINAKSLLGLAKRHGKPVVVFGLFALYSCLFAVYAVGAVLRPLIRPIYDHAFKPILKFLGTEEHLERYKKKLDPIREFNLTNKVSEWVERGKGHGRARRQGSRGMV